MQYDFIPPFVDDSGSILYRIKPLRWHEAADGLWIASSQRFSYSVSEYDVGEYNWVAKDRMEDYIITTGNCTSVAQGKAQAEQHHFQEVEKDLIKVRIDDV